MKALSAAGSTALLTAVSLFSQAVGFLYRVALSRTVGAQVMGLYQLVMPVLSVVMSLTAVGFTVACSNLTAQYHALGDRRAAGQVVRECVLGFLTAFLAVAALAAPLSDWISVRLLGDARTRLGVLLILPCVLLTGLENIHKHYFYGAGQVTAPAVTEICEQVIRAGAVLGLLWRFLPRSPEGSVGLILCGMILCEVFSALTLTLLYRRAQAGAAGEGTCPAALRRRVRAIALPIGWTALLGNLMGAATSVMIPQRLVHSGARVDVAMGEFGVLCGMTVPMLSLPTALIGAMSLVLVPRLARWEALGRRDLAGRQVDRALSAAAACILPAAGVLAVLSPTLGRLLFREPDAGAFAAPLALGVVLSCGEAVLGACLNGLGRQKVHARNSLISGAFQLLVTWVRMGRPGVGLRGYVEGLVLSTVLGLWLNWHAVRRALGLRPDWFRWVLAPGLAAALAALDANLLLRVLAGSGMGPWPRCAVTLAFAALVYLGAMKAMGAARPGQG